MVTRPHCFTLKLPFVARILVTPIAFATPSLDRANQSKFDTRALWDTGASGTVITQNVVDALGLKPTGIASVNTASEKNKQTNTFEIDVFLSKELVFPNVTVTLGVIMDGVDCLLGMDIISTGDFSITNLNGNTCMSFRYPSAHEIDFVKTPEFGRNTNPIFPKKVSRNDLCPCGSGKKYKFCGMTAKPPH